MTKSLQRRLRVFSVAVVLVAILLAGRLAWLQIYNYEHYLARAEDNRERSLQITATRGEIFDANGELLATNRAGFAVSILDLSSRDAPHVIAYLSEILEIEEEVIKNRIFQERYRRFAPIRIASDVSQEVVAKIEERRMELPGVIIETLPVRHYEHGSLAAHVLGFVGVIQLEQQQRLAEQGHFYRLSDYIGREGLEDTWELYLRGQDGVERVEVNSVGRRTRVLSREEPVAGHDIYLTLDARLQEISERVLAEVIEELREGGSTQVGKGSVVAMDPNTGAILAMVSYPAFDLNTVRQNYLELDANKKEQPLRNKTISDVYPVGSTYKMVAAMGALEEGLIAERSIVRCTGRKVFFRGEHARGCFNGTVHGSLNVVSALARSCNMFFFEMGLRLGVDKLTDYARAFGFGAPTGLTDLRREIGGSLLRRREGVFWAPGDVLTAVIGQGHDITPLQLANYGAMLANGGIHYRPYLVQQAVDTRGRVAFEAEPEILNQLEYSEENWAIVRKGMEAVTVPGGTASSMRNLPIQVAAKTGSAQAGGRGSNISAHSLFVGHAPAQNPEIALAIIVEHGGLGSHGAVPTASRILQEYYAPPVEEDRDTITAPTE